MDIVQEILERDATNKRKTIEVKKNIELDIDLGSLLACDTNALDEKHLRSKTEEYLKDLTRDNVQLLINDIWKLPTERVEEVIVAQLPKPEYVLPRFRVLPKPRQLTKWEQFAKEKGIQSKKKGKSKLKWDDELQKWIPSFGYKRAKAEEQKEWLVEMNKNEEPKMDPFTEAKVAKEEKKAKNELQRLRNIAKSKNIKLPQVGLPTTDHFQSSKQLATAVTIARTSTASVGKFQQRLPKEKDAGGIAKQVPGVKRKAKDVPLSFIEEKRRNTTIAENVLKANAKILRDDVVAAPTTSNKKSSKSSKSGLRSKKQKDGKVVKGSRKPSGGKGGRDMRLKVGGRKRR